MAIELHDERGREGLRRAGRAAALTLQAVARRVRVGTRTLDIDRWVREDTARRGGTPSQLGYHGFPAAVCTSPNEVVCHGIPSARVRLMAGDIVNVDVTTQLGPFHGDTSTMVVLEPTSEAAAHVVRVAREALWVGIGQVHPGVRLGDVGAAIEEHARRHGCGVVRELGGHGIGRLMHMEPHVSHHGPAGRGVRLRPGMAFTLEPMLTLGSPGLRTLDDGWTVVTADGSPSAQFEHSLLVTEHGVEVLTVLSEGRTPQAEVPAGDTRA